MKHIYSDILEYNPQIQPISRGGLFHEKNKNTTLYEMIDNINYIHGLGRYDLSQIDQCDNFPKEVKIICKNHHFIAEYKDFARGRGMKLCPICKKAEKGMSAEEYMHKVNKINKNLVLINNNDMVVYGDLIELKCTKHDRIIKITSGNPLNYNVCKLCSSENKKPKISTPQFIKSAMLVHGDEFDYSKTIYTGRHKKLIISHKLCGTEFEMTAGNHLNGQKCPKCRNIRISETAKNTHHLNDENRYEPCNVYLVRLLHVETNKKFFKVGITRQTIKQRFKNESGFVVDFQMVLLSDTYEECVKYEEQIHEFLKVYRYRLKFLKNELCGWTECYTGEVINENFACIIPWLEQQLSYSDKF